MAAPAPAAPADERDKPRAVWPIILQGLALYFVFTQLRSSTSRAAAPAPVAAPSPDASASAAPAAPPATGPLAEFSRLFETIKEASSGKKRVAPELQAYEDARLAALAAAQRRGASLRNAWPPAAAYDVSVFLSTSAEPLDLGAAEAAAAAVAAAPAAPLANASFDGLLAAAEPGAAPLFWRQAGLAYAGGAARREQHVNVSLPPAVLANASRVYAHVFFARAGTPLDPAAPGYERARVASAVVPLVKFLKRKPVKPRFSLLGDDAGGNATAPAAREMKFGIATTDAARDELAAARRAASEAARADDAPPAAAAGGGAVLMLPYWKPTLHLQLVVDHSVIGAGALPPMVAPAVDVVELAGGELGYTPHFYLNDFWLLSHHLVAINASVPVVPLTVSVSTVAMWRWAIESQMTTSWEVQSSMGTSTDSDTDMIKGILTDTNPVLLAVTVTVSLLHSVFDFLAFRNDISFWRSAKSLVGLSVRTVAMSVFFQGVIFLYLLDFGDTSYMILMSTGVGLAIEVWKLVRAMGGSVAWAGWRPIINWGVKEVSYAISKTQEYDAIATSHLLFLLYPLVAGYAAYSLVLDTHRSWYSWVLSSLVSFIYLFGFVNMVPQLYINYRLKSVAHLPWKTMSYKFLNTIIDDLFAFVVKMPTLHRVACFRDDVIFLIYLYQRWIYRVDLTRRNEYGQAATDAEIAELLASRTLRASRRSKFEVRDA
jgi:hypothetical protein